MTIQTHPEFETEVTRALEELQAAIRTKIDEIVAMWNNCFFVKHYHWLGIAVKLWVSSKLRELEASIREVWRQFSEACAKIWEKVKEWTGNPLSLMGLRDDYNQAAAGLLDEAIVLENILREVRYTWSGTAFERFSDVVNDQKACVTDAASALSGAATGYAEGALKIAESWSACVTAILDYCGDAVDALNEATDAGKIVTMDVGPGTKIFLDLLVRVAKLLNDLGLIFAAQATLGVDSWTKLQSGGGAGGLDANNDWIRVGRSRPDLEKKGNWEPK